MRQTVPGQVAFSPQSGSVGSTIRRGDSVDVDSVGAGVAVARIHRIGDRFRVLTMCADPPRSLAGH
jgi:hypothetical protein